MPTSHTPSSGVGVLTPVEESLKLSTDRGDYTQAARVTGSICLTVWTIAWAPGISVLSSGRGGAARMHPDGSMTITGNPEIGHQLDTPVRQIPTDLVDVGPADSDGFTMDRFPRRPQLFRLLLGASHRPLPVVACKSRPAWLSPTP
jgi:hypothetical protein